MQTRRPWPFHLLPRTLLWQTFITFALTLILAQGAWFQIFRYFQEPARARDLAQMMSSVVNLTRTALVHVEDLQRTEFLLDLLSLEGIRIYPSEPSDQIVPLPDTRPMQLLTLEVRRQLGEDTLIATRWKTLDGLWVSFRLTPNDPDMFWVMMPPERLQQNKAFDWLMWSAGALLVALLGALWSVSHISSSLGRLARGARIISAGETPPILPESGPLEIATVARTFNQMAESLAHSASERALILAGVSHDLRTPLARLRLGIEMSCADEGEISAMVADIESMDQIIGQFLDFGRERSQEPLQEIDITHLVAAITEPYRLRKLPIHLQLPAHCTLSVRPLLFRRAITNLIDNAIRYAGSQKAIEIALEEDASEVRIEVCDRGPGIPAAETSRMLQPFTRLEEARTNTKGAGLGLAIIDHILRSHNGHISLLPREGGGLRAILHFPRASAQPTQKQPAPGGQHLDAKNAYTNKTVS